MKNKQIAGVSPDVVGSKGARTRDLLVDSAIACLAERGYSGTTMRLIAERAGVTQGPRQYYFPTPTSIYQAVVARIHDQADASLTETRRLSASLSLEDRLRANLVPAFKACGKPNNLAMIELKLACRGDAKLREAIMGQIEEYEARNDELWLSDFAAKGVSRQAVINLRMIVGATLRGLAVAIASGAKNIDRKALCEQSVQICLQQLKR